MVKGKRKTEDLPEEFDSVRIEEERYQYELDRFEGVPYYHHGILDELDNLKELLMVIGESVLSQEREFKKIEKEESDPHIGIATDRMIENWYRKQYRPFSYKAMVIMIQSTFENAIVRLHSILKDFRRIEFDLKNNYLVDNLKEFQKLELTINNFMEQVRVYNYIRNRLIHNDGYCLQTDKPFQEMKKFARVRSDISIKKFKSPINNFTHKIEIQNSSFINDLLLLNKNILVALVASARKAVVIEPPLNNSEPAL
jgi:hypothetical protein